MPNPELYKGREQTYVKHFVLKNYLERVAYNIFSFANDFVYIDGFSGPWKSETESYEDTSFRIAIDKLRAIRDGLKKDRNKDVKFRCLFIEKDKGAFQELQKSVGEIRDIEIKLINGSFEDNIPEICNFIGRSFSLVFIDPTGWTGFDLTKIAPLLMLKGEVLINFMTDFIIRFVSDPRPEIIQSFDPLFGPNWYPEWQKLVAVGMSNESATVEIYNTRLKQAGDFEFVTSTRIKKPTLERSYFHLIYATRHWKGVKEFRFVEEKAIDAQEDERNAAKYRISTEKTGMDSLFGQKIMETGGKSYEQERNDQAERGYKKLVELLKQNKSGIKYEDLLGRVLEIPLVWDSDLNHWLDDMRKAKKVEIPNMKPRERVPKKGYLVKPTDKL